MDTLTRRQRSERMALIRAKNSKPELIVRRLLHAMGFRYRLHDRSLPGAPDIVFRRHRKVIFVHGCYWHRHRDPACRLGGRMPKSRLDYWKPKFARNLDRDRYNERALNELGWQFLVVWECEIRDREHLENSLRHFLGA